MHNRGYPDIRSKGSLVEYKVTGNLDKVVTLKYSQNGNSKIIYDERNMGHFDIDVNYGPFSKIKYAVSVSPGPKVEVSKYTSHVEVNL